MRDQWVVVSCRTSVDVEPRLFGEMFEPLRDYARFGGATVDEELGTGTWPNGADLSPEFLYDPRSREHCVARARGRSSGPPTMMQTDDQRTLRVLEVTAYGRPDSLPYVR